MKVEKVTMKSLDGKSKKECWDMSNEIIRKLVIKKSLAKSGTAVKPSEIKALKKNHARVQTFINKK